MTKEIEYLDWTYLKSDAEGENRKAYQVKRIHDISKTEICANDGERLFKPISELELITDAALIQELESENKTGSYSPEGVFFT